MKHENATDVSGYKSRVSRRGFLRGGGAAVAGGGLAGMSATAVQAAAVSWTDEADIVVVGSGSVLPAALAAHEGGAKVIVLEKGASVGGTTSLSGGVFWIPNNPVLRKDGVADGKADAMRYLVRVAHPSHYHADDQYLGVGKQRYALLEALYDRGPEMVQFLTDVGAIKPMYWQDWDGRPVPDYYADLAINKVPRGRGLVVTGPDGKAGVGTDLIKQLKAALDARKVPILLEHRATRLVVNSRREVVGVEAEDADGKPVRFRARKGVIFGTGGFTHNKELREGYLRGPVYSGCGPIINTGDFIPMATSVGAKLANMPNAWWYPQVAELAFATSATGLTAGMGAPGDSVIYVDKFGRRPGNEKSRYSDRGQLHFKWDPVRGEFTNLVLFQIFDQRTRDKFRGGPIPPPDANARWLLTAPTLPELVTVISERLKELRKFTGDFALDPAFAENLPKTIKVFNRYAEQGVDLDYHRGESQIDLSSHGPRVAGNDKPNPTMYPLSTKGPYYCVMIVGGTLDTKGGPKINELAQVLDINDQPIRGLFGAGNCIGSPNGEGYHAGGATIGSCMTYAYIAARQALKEDEKRVDA